MRIGFSHSVTRSGGNLTLYSVYNQTSTLVDQTAYNEQIGTLTGYNGTEPYSYSKVSGSTEITINPTTGAITFNGTADKDTPASATLRVTDDDLATYDYVMTIQVQLIALNATTFAPTTPNVPWYPWASAASVTVATGNGGYAPFVFTIDSPAEFGIQNTNEVWKTAQITEGNQVVTVRTTDAEGQTRTDTVTVDVQRSTISAAVANPASPSIDSANAPILVSTFTTTGGYAPVQALLNISNADYNNPSGGELWLQNAARPYQTDVITLDVQDAAGQTFSTSITVTLEEAVSAQLINALRFLPNGEYTLSDENAVEPKSDTALVLGEDGIWRPGTAGVSVVCGNSSGARQVKQLLADGAAPATETVTVVSGKTYTLQGTGTYDYALTGAHTGSLTGTAQHKALTFATTSTSLTITVNTAGDTWQLETGDLPSEIVDGPRNSVKLFNYLNGNTVDGSGLVTITKGPNITDPTRQVEYLRTYSNDMTQYTPLTLGAITATTIQFGDSEYGFVRDLDAVPVGVPVTLWARIRRTAGTSTNVAIHAQVGGSTVVAFPIGQPNGERYAVTILDGNANGNVDFGLTNQVGKGGDQLGGTWDFYDAGYCVGINVPEHVDTAGATVVRVYDNAGTHITVDATTGIVTEGTPYNEYPVLYPYQRAYPARSCMNNDGCDATQWNNAGCVLTNEGAGIVAGFNKTKVEDAEGATATNVVVHTLNVTAAAQITQVWYIDKEPLNADGSWMRFSGASALDYHFHFNKETGATNISDGGQITAHLVEQYRHDIWRVFIQSTALSAGSAQTTMYPAQLPQPAISPESVGSFTVHAYNVWNDCTIEQAKGLPIQTAAQPVTLAGQTTFPIDVLGAVDGFDETLPNMVTMEVKTDFDLNRTGQDRILGTDAALLRGAIAGANLESSDGTSTASAAIGSDTTATPVLVAVIASKPEDSLQVRISGTNGTPTTHSGTFNTGTLLRLFQSLTATAGARNLTIKSAGTVAELEAQYNTDYAAWLPAREVPHVQITPTTTQGEVSVTVPTFNIWDTVTVKMREKGTIPYTQSFTVTSSPHLQSVSQGDWEYSISFDDTSNVVTSSSVLTGLVTVVSPISSFRAVRLDANEGGMDWTIGASLPAGGFFSLQKKLPAAQDPEQTFWVAETETSYRDVYSTSTDQYEWRIAGFESDQSTQVSAWTEWTLEVPIVTKTATDVALNWEWFYDSGV